MGHDHGPDGHRSSHDHQGHHHHAAVGADNERRVLLALLLTGTFMLVEAVGGVIAGSLALIADAGHMLTDTAALALAWVAFRVANRPADPRRSYGYHRVQVLAAFANGGALLMIVIWIAVEAVRRLFDPVEVLGGTMLAIAAVGLLVNGVAFWLLRGGDRENLNIRAASLHIMGDLLGSVGAIAAAGVILATGWWAVDPILSLLVSLLILASAWRLVRQSGHILMEGTPSDVDSFHLRELVPASVPEVIDVHHVHIWSLTPERPVVTLHARIDRAADHDAVLARIKKLLLDRFGIDHSTIQIEHGDCADEIATAAASGAARAD